MHLLWHQTSNNGDITDNSFMCVTAYEWYNYSCKLWRYESQAHCIHKVPSLDTADPS